jgi:hypothetical protein
LSARRPAIAGGAIVALIGALLLAGCGGGGESDAERHQAETQVERATREARLKALLKVKLAEHQRREENPGQTLAPEGYSDAQAERYEVDREVCSALSPSELAASFGIDEGSDAEAIAEAYSKSFEGEYRQPSYEGCLAGLE